MFVDPASFSLQQLWAGTIIELNLLQVDQGKMPDRQALYLIELEVWSGIGRLREVRLIPGLRAIKFVSELNLAREDKVIASHIAQSIYACLTKNRNIRHTLLLS
jgi:hypothetical protein